jgi:hypothetical protein
MVHAPSEHFGCQVGVALRDEACFNQPPADVAVDRMTFVDRPDEHVHFDVLAQQVLPTQQGGINPPHSHDRFELL